MALPLVRPMLVSTSFQIAVSFFSYKVKVCKCLPTLNAMGTYVRASAGPVDGEHTKIVGSKTPDGKGAAERRDTRIGTLEHSIRGKSVPLLTGCFFLHVGDASCNILFVDSVTTALAELELLLKLLALVIQPLCNLLATERQLARAVGEIKDRKGVIGVKFTSDGKGAATRCRNRPTSLVTGSSHK